MSVKVTDLSSLDESKVTAEQSRQVSLSQSLNPNLDFKTGVLRDLVVKLTAILGTSLGQDWERLQRSQTLSGINEDPTLADDDIVDSLLSNYLIFRKAGIRSRGSLTIVLTRASEITIPAGSVFVSDGLNYVTERSFAAQSSESSLLSETDRLLTQRSGGTWSFIVDVVAEKSGPHYRLSRGVLATPTNTPNNFEKAFATTDFTDGTDTQLNSDLTSQVSDGLSARVLSGRANMSGLLTAEYPNVVASTVIGAGEPEMLRDSRSIFPISTGGRADWYVKTRSLPTTATFNVECSLISLLAGEGTWQFTLGRDQAPGMYEVKSVLPTESPSDSGTLTILSTDRGVDLSDVNLPPDVQGDEVGFSSYQTASVKFTDNVSDHSSSTIGDTRNYTVVASYMDEISDIQNYVQQLGLQHYGGDVLVKAPVPCFLGVGITIHKPATMESPDITAIKQNVAVMVNGTGFPGHVTASQISEVVHNSLQSPAGVSEMTLRGKIIKPSGEIQILTSNTRIVVPDSPEEMVTKKTVSFYLDAQDISISVQNL